MLDLLFSTDLRLEIIKKTELIDAGREGLRVTAADQQTNF